EHGCLHGDPHPGNFIFGDDGVISVLDYGCTQHLCDDMVAGLEDLARTAIRGGTDAEMLGPLCRALGLPLDLEPKLSSHLLAFARAMLEPVSAPQPFAFGHDHTTQLMERATKAKLVMARTALTHGVPTPQVDGAVLLMRASVGLAAMLGQLKSCADFRSAAGLD
ncbi:MAG: hypothetical protein GXP62_02180, partial [Oligoflexia bacterium]|nr:hypothetical protein [Oligoflexia bacterium]